MTNAKKAAVINKYRHYYQVTPQKVEKREYHDIFYSDNTWKDVIPTAFDENGKPREFWYRDNQMTKSNRIENERNGHKTKEYVVTQKFPVCFDIETNSITEKENGRLKFCQGYMYHAQILIDCYIIHCTKWNEVLDVFNVLSEKMQCGQTHKNAKKIVRIWDANLGFEFAFIARKFEWSRIFASKPRKPITAETKSGLLFQDALMISGSSLEKMSKLYELPTKKTHDLDYHKIRISTTPLSEKEIQYTSFDVRILGEFHEYLMKNYVENGLDVPITKTQMIRDSVKKLFNELEIYKGKKSFFAERVEKLHFQSYDEYSEMIRFLFRGGYSHANCQQSEKVIENVFGWDFTSSYPYCMLFSHSYPVTPFRSLTNVKIEDIIDLDKKGYATISKIEFEELRPKTQHSIESISKTIEYEKAHMKSLELQQKGQYKSWWKIYNEMVQPVIDNGRLLAANHVTVWLTEIDVRNYEMFYTWKNAKVLECKKACKGDLPDYVRFPIMVYYERKNRLKKQGLEETTEYKLSKEMVNAFYGMMCEKLHLTDYVYENESGEWVAIEPDESKVDDEYLLEVFGEKCLQGVAPCKNKLPAVWGIYTTAIARHNLLKIVATINKDALYCDTDSVYVKNYKKYKKLIERYNAAVKKNNEIMIDEWNENHKDNEKITPITKEYFLDLGTFDPIIKGAYYTRFKTLGAKRYLKESKKKGLEQTIAGLPKGKLKEYCESFSWGADPFGVFENDMQIPNTKKAHCYNDEPHEMKITDYLGNTEIMKETSSCGLFEVDFSLSMSDSYMELIEMGIKESLRKYYKGEYTA